MADQAESLPELRPVPGVRLGAAEAGIRYHGRPDLAVIECVPGTEAAAVFTRNRFCAAPVVVARLHLERRRPRALLINAGNANAGTGEAGCRDAVRCCEALAERLGCEAAEVLPFSTGVIGERLPVERIVQRLPDCVQRLSETGWGEAARAIMTTDTRPKGASRRVEVEGRPVTVTGIAKGAGMIRPDMATMLAFVATDAPLTPAALQALVSSEADGSFHRITVDGDTSTNDACVLLSTGRAAVERIETIGSRPYEALRAAVGEVMQALAQAIVRDAEGATKFITVEVRGGPSEADCLAVAFTVAESPLVKTACFASDPNWGRILAAVGRAPVPLDPARVSIHLGATRVVRAGALDPDYREEAGRAAMAGEEILIGIDLGAGKHRAAVWTSDLSHEYVRVNAEYRT